MNPSLYQVNTRVWLTALSGSLGRRATLDDIPDAKLDEWKRMGFDWIWMLGVWRTGSAGQEISRRNPEWRSGFEAALPDVQEEDIGGSCFAISSYNVADELGGNEALERLRERLQQRDLKLMLDFVPNHMAPDHPWTQSHPDYFIPGPDGVPEQGRDPNYPGWPDTLQLDYGNPELQDAMMLELGRIASQCDGVRCDMAMLLLPEVFERTWGRTSAPFWPVAIPRIRETYPDFCFMAEVYWDLEWTLQQQGFDYTYDKRLYDRLRDGCTESVRGHLCADLDFQNKLVRFLENHDEPRAATTFDLDMYRAAAVITYTIPGLRFFHQGQLDGWTKQISPHLVRGPEEVPNQSLTDFHEELLAVLRNPIFKSGTWQRIDCPFIAHAWRGEGGERVLVVVNYAPQSGRCTLELPFPKIRNHSIRLRDFLGPAVFDCDGTVVVDLEPWAYHVFHVEVLK